MAEGVGLGDTMLACVGISGSLLLMQYSRGDGVSSLPAPHPHCRVAVAVSLLILAWWEEHRVGTAFLQHCQDPVVPGEEVWWGPPSVLGPNLHIGMAAPP